MCRLNLFLFGSETHGMTVSPNSPTMTRLVEVGFNFA